MTLSSLVLELFGPAVAAKLIEWRKGSEAKRLVRLLRGVHPGAPALLTQPDCLHELWWFSTTGEFRRDEMLRAVAQIEPDAAAADALTDAIEQQLWRAIVDDDQRHFELLHLRHQLQASSDAATSLVLGRLDALIATLTPAVSALHQLPPDTAAFVDRHAERERARAAAERTRASGLQAAAIVSFSGMGGTGKSSLAIRVAHELRAAYPDGQLYANMRRTDGSLQHPAEVAAAFLRDLGVDEQTVPSAADARYGLLRSVLAERKAMIVLDNVQTESQIRPLIPATPDCLVVATSRPMLAGLDGAELVSVEGLDADDALELLRQLVGPERIDAELDAARELCALCGQLPLALRTVAATLRRSSLRSVAELVAALHDEEARLDHMSEVRASFLLSYRELTAPEAQLLRLVAELVHGEADPELAAALLGCDASTAAALLERLAEQELLRETSSRRYAIHALMRLFAKEMQADHGDPEQLTGASDRLNRKLVGETAELARILRSGSHDD